MTRYVVTGMTCAACQARVEKAVSSVPGVMSCSVSLLTNSMGVEGDAAESEIIGAVENAGYGASLMDTDAKNKSSASARLTAEEDALKDRTSPVLLKRLAASVVFLLILMYFSMGHMMFSFPVGSFFEKSHAALGLLQMLLAAAVMVINQQFFISGFKALIHRAPNMDTLIALGSSAAFLYSTAMLFAAIGSNEPMKYMNEMYFESAAMILTLITVGKLLEARSKGRTTDALKSLMKLAPQTATVVRGSEETVVPVDSVMPGDLFVVRPGESFPVDGVVIEGSGAVNESALTGESIPVEKSPGSEVSSGTVNQTGFMKCRAVRVGEDTSLSKIITLVSNAAATKAPAQKLADRISGVFVPIVMAIAAVTTVIWLLVGRELGFALARGICVLVVSCPCALGLATPVAIMVGSGVGAKNGILFKTAAALQETGRVDTVVLDKTGTITKGSPEVTDVIPAQGVTEEQLLELSSGLESKSEHPLARAVMEYTETLGIRPAQTDDFTALPGNGLSAVCGGRLLIGGSVAFVGSKAELPAYIAQACEKLSDDGKTPLLFADGPLNENNGGMRLLGVIAVADALREDSAEAIRQLRLSGLKTLMLTGDNERTARAIGRLVGADEVISGVRPEGKEEVVRRFQRDGGNRKRVAMVGDGINDAPALASADVGIAIGAGTDVAIDAADVVLVKSRLSDVVTAIRLSRRVYKGILQNLFWALFYNSLLIPVAAGALIPFGVTMEPMFGAAAMSLSSFCVVANALRINRFRPFDAAQPSAEERQSFSTRAPALSAGTEDPVAEADNDTLKGANQMTRTMKIEGMMCEHCEARVKKALEAVPGVNAAVVSHKDGTAVVTSADSVDDGALRSAVEAQDYAVKDIA
ncbi:MAG: heavy metal translocating P-type ATPase [Clostridia bacterium]|nr:heavy metal translocating P-type ATPase [Clostridia bacterium]